MFVFIEFLEENSDLLRAPSITIFIELFHSNEYSGFMDEEISSFSEIFLKTAIDEPLIDSYILNKKLDKTTEFYNSLLHELTHSFDWIINSKNDYLIAKNSLGEDPVQGAVILTRVIKSLRMEGLAGISTLTRRGMIKDNKALVNLNELFEDYEDYLSQIYSFFEGMYTKDILWLKKKEKEIYDSGAVQYIGFWMALLIFIKEYSSNAKYFFTETAKSKTLLNSMNEHFNHDRLIKDQEGIWLDWSDTGKYLVDTAKNYKSKIISMITDKESLAGFSSVFIKKIAIMPPTIFLEKFLDAAKTLSIDYGPITPDCISKLNKKKKEKIRKSF